MNRIYMAFIAFFPLVANASEMQGLALFISLPISGLLLLISVLVAALSGSKSGYKYLVVLSFLAAAIAVIMASVRFTLADDKSYYIYHLILTILVFLSPLLLALRLKNKNN